MRILWVVLEVIGVIVGLALIGRIAWEIYIIATAVGFDDGPHFAAMSRREAEKRAAESKTEEECFSPDMLSPLIISYL